MLDLSLIISSLRISVPYTAGALGGTLTERSGTVNIAIEGFMLTGAFAFACAAYYCQTAWLPQLSVTVPWIPLVVGLFIAIGAAVALSLIHAATTLLFKANHIVSGLAINFLALGMTDFLLQKIFGSASNSPQVPVFLSWNFLAEGSAAASLNGLLHPLILLVLFFAGISYWVLNRTRLGLRLRAAGENPLAASAAGISPGQYRLYGILMGAGFAAIGGVWLVSEQGLFSSNMTAGRGYIALAAMILGRWRVWSVAAVCVFFGFAEALQNFLQTSQGSTESDGWGAQWLSSVPTQLIQALPYILTIIVVAGFVGRSKAPAAVGRPLTEE